MGFKVTDAVTVAVAAATTLSISVSDGFSHTDTVAASPTPLNISVADSFKHTDQLTAALDQLNLSIADSYSYTDDAALEVTAASDLNLSVEDNYKHTDIAEVRSIPWYHAEALTINTGAISSGNLANTYADDGTELVLTEVNGTPGFSYDFTFGTDQQVPAYNLSFNLKGYYEGNAGHAVELRQYNYTTTNWDEVRADTKDFPHNTSEQTYNYPLLTAADYKSGGQLKLRIIHTTAGASTHLMHIDRMWLSSAEPNPSIADSYLFTESVALSIDSLHISVADGYFYSESPQASVDPLYLDVADNYSHTDAASASLPSTDYSNLQIMSLKLSDKLSLSISVKGDCIPISLLSGAPSGAPPAGRGLVAYIDSGTLKLAAWTGSAWVTT